MFKKLRKSSSRVTLVLVGVAALSGCGDEDGKRDVYASREDCLADWNNKPADCEPATEPQHRNRGYFYGPIYSGSRASSSSSWGNGTGGKSHSIGSSSSSSRGGFGASGHSSGG